RLQSIQMLVTAGSKSVSRSRRQKCSAAKSPSANRPAMQRLLELTEVKILDSPPSKERIVAIPPEESGTGRERVLMRIGRRQSGWNGSFERGNNETSTAHLLPDGHLFVCANGARYILERTTHTL